VTDFRQTHPNGVILALDQMSAYLQATLTRVWSPIGQTPYVWVTPQRECLHFYGALNVLSGQEVVLALPRLDGDHTIHFLEHLAACFPHRPILVLWDRAPWHKGKARRFIEAHPQFDMLYFPPGCPDLNPQEHVWKQTRQAVGHLCQYRHISALRQTFQSYMENTLFHFDWLANYLPPAFYESVFI
jgi:transposase